MLGIKVYVPHLIMSGAVLISWKMVITFHLVLISIYCLFTHLGMLFLSSDYTTWRWINFTKDASPFFLLQPHERSHKLLCDRQRGRTGPCCFHRRYIGKTKTLALIFHQGYLNHRSVAGIFHYVGVKLLFLFLVYLCLRQWFAPFFSSLYCSL